MPNLKEIKARITSVGATQQITKAMKMVAAAKLRKAQSRAWQLRPYFQSLRSMMYALVHSQGRAEELLLCPPKDDALPHIVVPIASDKGLCGSFNATVVKSAVKHVAEAPEHTRVLPLGKRPYEFFSKRWDNIEKPYAQIFSPLTYEAAAQVADALMDSYLSGACGRVLLIYQEAKNTATQLLRVTQLLPIELPPLPPTQEASVPTDMLYEPSKEAVLAAMLPLYVRTQCYVALAESFAAEQGARMTAMDKASSNADQLLKDLRLVYNRTRQAVITGEILEIVGGANALKEN